MSKNESLLFSIYTIDNEYFLEEVSSVVSLDHYQTQESDYWLGKHGSDRKVWICR